MSDIIQDVVGSTNPSHSKRLTLYYYYYFLPYILTTYFS